MGLRNVGLGMDFLMEGSLRLPARFEIAATARHVVRALLAAADAPDDAMALAELAAGELIANAMDHGLGTNVDVALRVLPDAAVLAVTNVGPAFDRRPAVLSSMMCEERGRGLALLIAFGCVLSVEHSEVDRCTVTATVPLCLSAAAAVPVP